MDFKPNSGTLKAELISTLSDIDIKINSLHGRSNSDFMQLNDYLKEYHRKTRTISENAFRIFETISGGKDMDLIKELGNIQKRIEEYRANIDGENERKLKIYTETGLKANQLNLVIKNLRQDFTSLKFLSTNYALISSYNDTEESNTEVINLWIKNISSIHQVLISLNDHVEKFRNVVTKLVDQLEQKIDESIEIFQNLTEETNRNLDSVSRKNLESKQQFPVLKEKSLDSSRCINDIITHLQYHDIIRQKIEHIQKSHYKIIDDLNLTQGKNKGDFSTDDYDKIGDIIELQAAQMLLVSKEYQNALNVITKNFQVIAKDMTIVSDISGKFSLDNSSSEITLLRQIKDQLDKGLIQLDRNNPAAADLLLGEALEKFQVISGLIQNEIMPEMAAFLETGGVGNNLHFKPAGAGVLSQMISLNRDIEIKNQEITGCMSELRNLITSTSYGDVWENDFEIDRLQLMVRITKTLDSLDRDNEELDKVLNENHELNDNVLRRIESAVNKSDYCEYFEDIVGQVIGQLTSINNRIKPSASTEERAENLRDLKTGYTMKSERIIHDMVVSGEEKTDEEDKEKENEIEFF